MFATTSELLKIDETPTIATTAVGNNFTLEDFTANPPDNMEWVDGQLVEKSKLPTTNCV